MNTRENPGASAWLIRAPDRPLPDHLEILTTEERARCARFRGEERQARFAAGRALLRRLLSVRLDLPPAQVPIVIGEKSRPRLALRPGGAGEDLDFNLSSTPGYVACALAWGARVGIDVEYPGRLLDMGALAKNVFTAAERTWWSGAGDAARNFCRLWTLKESVAKADGEGIGLPFGELTLLPDGRGGLVVDLDAIGERADAWRILELDTELPAALALRWTGAATGPVDLSPAWPRAGGFDPVPLEPGASTP